MSLYQDMEIDALIDGCRSHDDDAFDELVRRYTPMMRKVIFGFSNSAIGFGEMFSESCVALHSAVQSYDLEQSSVTFGLYAKICVERSVIDMHRREGRSTSRYVDSSVDVDKLAVPGGVQAMLEHREQTAYFLAVAKETLSDLEFDVYRYWILGYKTSDIASSLGITAKAVDNAKNRMWTKLRLRLSPEN